MPYLLSLVLGAVIFAQMLGLMHRLVHSPLEQPFTAAELQHLPDAHHSNAHDRGAEVDVGENHIHRQTWLETLFAGHEEGGNSCRVFDPQGQTALATAVASLALPSVLCAPLPPAGATRHLPVAAAPFQARAPPLSA